MKIKSKKAEIKRSLSLYALMAPSLILLILFSYLPMYGIIIAVKDYNADSLLLRHDRPDRAYD